MMTQRRPRRRCRCRLTAPASACIIPAVLLLLMLGGTQHEPTFVLASDQTAQIRAKEGAEEADTEAAAQRPPSVVHAEVHVEEVTAKVANARKLQIRSSTKTNVGAGTSVVAKDDMTLSQILAKAARKGLGGGIPGFVAGVIQVLTLMWLRTVVNYQSRYGTTFRQTLSHLFNDGGVCRFYRGIAFALVQAPMSRFVATFANDGCEALLASLETTKDWGPARGTMISSVVVGLWRVLLMPVDTCKTVLQVDSREGFKNLMLKVRAGKISVLYQGALALIASSMISYYPWFYSYRVLSESDIVGTAFAPGLVRNAFIGFSASVVSDVVSNGIRVIKTTKQSMGSRHAVSYGEAISIILADDGWRGLLGRGLKTRIFGNALQSVLFTIVWRGLAERWSVPNNDEANADASIEDDSKESSPTVARK